MNKGWLKQIIVLEQQIVSYQKEIEDLENLSGMLQGEKVQTSKKADKMDKTVVKILELKDRINKKIEQLLVLKEELSNAIDKISDPRQRLIMRYKYIENNSWKDIAAKTGYSRSYLFILHRQGLKEIEKEG